MGEFYSRFTEITKQHKENQCIPIADDANNEMLFENMVQFSGEEWHGRCVDMHTFYEQYLNLSVFNTSSHITQHVDEYDESTDSHKTKVEKRRVDYKLFLT